MINSVGLLLGVTSIVFGIIWIIKRDKLKNGYCKNWPDKAFYVFGLAGILSGIILILNLNLIKFLLAIDTLIFFGQSHYYNQKALKAKK